MQDTTIMEVESLPDKFSDESRFSDESHLAKPTLGKAYGDGEKDDLSQDPVFSKMIEEQGLTSFNPAEELRDDDGYELPPLTEDFLNDWENHYKEGRQPDFSKIDDNFVFDDEVKKNPKDYDQVYEDDPENSISTEYEVVLPDGRKATIGEMMEHYDKSHHSEDRVRYMNDRINHLEWLEEEVRELAQPLCDDDADYYANRVNYSNMSEEDFVFHKTQAEKWANRSKALRAELKAKQERERDEAFEKSEAILAQKADSAWRRLQQEIPYWSLEHWGKVQHHSLTKLGISYDDLGSLADAGIAKVLHKCYIAEYGEPDWKPKAKIKGLKPRVKQASKPAFKMPFEDQYTSKDTKRFK